MWKCCNLSNCIILPNRLKFLIQKQTRILTYSVFDSKYFVAYLHTYEHNSKFFVAYFTLIPAEIIVGIVEATMWPVMLLYCVHYARCYARYGSKSTQVYVTEFIGTFYLLFQFSAVSYK